MMEHVSSKQAAWVWIFLVFASVLTLWVAEDTALFGPWTFLAVTAVAYLKARALVLYYMEVRFAPLQLRFAFEAWLALVTLGLAVFWVVQEFGMH